MYIPYGVQRAEKGKTIGCTLDSSFFGNTTFIINEDDSLTILWPAVFSHYLFVDRCPGR